MEGGVSIVIPVYNTEPELLERALTSIAQQTLNDIEVVIVDDGSTLPVNSWAGMMIDQLREKAPVQLIRSAENRGISHARNVGVSNSTRDWLVWLDADDALHPRCVEELLAASNGYDLVIGQCEVWNQGRCEKRLPGAYFEEAISKLRTIDDPFLLNVISVQPQIIRKSTFLTVGGFDEEYRYAEMTELFLRFITKYGIERVRCITNAIYHYYREREGSHSSHREALISYREKCLTKYMHDNCITGRAVKYVSRAENTGMQRFEIVN